jgi:hypothetical protein
LDEEDARRLLLVRAVETEEGLEALLTPEDRQQATAAALAGQPRNRGAEPADDAFLARRASFAFGRLTTRSPAVGQAYRRTEWPRWLNWVLPLGALAIGIVTNELDSGKRLNLIAFPLLGMLAWNLGVYALLAMRLLRRIAGGRRHDPGPRRFSWLTAPLAALGRPHYDAQQPLGRALARFARDWMRLASPLILARVGRTLHLSAAALAAGVIVGMYLRGLAVEYRAGWESTFMDVGGVHALLTLVLSPASWLTGIPLAGPDHLEALRWSGPGSGENAGAWIHLYAATALLFIVVPRLLLAGWAAVAAARRRRHLPVPGREDFYVRRLLRAASGGAAEVRVVPYSFHPPEPTRQTLKGLLTAALGDDTAVTFDQAIEYGAEDEWLSRFQPRRGADYLLVLFNLAATPETENHGALVAGVRQAMERDGSGVGFAVLLDGSGYRQRLAGQAGSDRRMETRRGAWERMLSPLGIRPLFVDLEADEAPALVKRLESLLIQSPTLVPAGDRT